jgi:hypothetical protein
MKIQIPKGLQREKITKRGKTATTDVLLTFLSTSFGCGHLIY